MKQKSAEPGTSDIYKHRIGGAFTLLELLVVIGIISVLLAILMPSLGKVRSLANRLKCAHNLKQISLAFHFYLEANDDTYPCADDPVSEDPFYCLWMGRGWRKFVEPYLATNDVNNSSVLICPQDKSDPDKYKSTSYAYSMAFYHSVEQIDKMNDRSATWMSLTPDVPSVPQKLFNVANPAGKILVGEWYSNHCHVEGKDDGWWCWLGSRNYLFADTHIEYLKAKQIRKARDGLPDINLTFGGIKGIDSPRSD